jgi:hypothetical protein
VLHSLCEVAQAQLRIPVEYRRAGLEEQWILEGLKPASQHNHAPHAIDLDDRHPAFISIRNVRGGALAVFAIA